MKNLTPEPGLPPEPCPQWAEKLAARHPDDLSFADRLALTEHLATCSACTATLAAYQSVADRIRSLPPVSPELMSKYSLNIVQKNDLQQNQYERPKTMTIPVSRFYQGRALQQRLGIIAAVCFVILVVGSMVAVFNLRRGATTPAATPVVTSVPVPPTQTSCPVGGAARAAVMAPLSLGTHQNVVFITYDVSGNTTAASILQRYDVTTGHTTRILRVANTQIDQAQVSADGQWVLFLSQVANQSEIQLVRMDGQGLQTLYCYKGSSGGEQGYLQWCPDQTLIVFDQRSSNGSGTTMKLLNMVNGNIRTLFTSQSPMYAPRSWLDNTHIYITNVATDVAQGPGAPANPNLYLLDIKKGPNQHLADLHLVLKGTTICQDFSSSPNGTTLVTSKCYGLQEQGPSSMSVQPAMGGSQRTVYSSQTFPILMVRMISNTTVLFTIHNQSLGGGNVDTSKNGLWKINTDGSGLVRLSTDTPEQRSMLNQFSRASWSDASRDGSMYAFAQDDNSGGGVLLFGRLSGGVPQTFATNGVLVGWTTM